MLQLTVGLFIFMYILGSAFEETGLVEKGPQQLKMEQKIACDRANDEGGVFHKSTISCPR